MTTGKDIKIAAPEAVAQIGNEVYAAAHDGARAAVQNILGDDFIHALRAVVSHCWDAEEDDYERRPKRERANHIFASLKVLDRWLANLKAEAA